MKIGIVSTHSWPLPPPVHTGDVVLLDLATALAALGHEVTLYAPEGTTPPTGVGLRTFPPSLGQAPPWSWDCEQACFDLHANDLHREDIVHDFSITKRVVESLAREGRTNLISTLMGGQWAHPNPPKNIVVWSKAMRERGLRGVSDYEGTQFTEWMGPAQPPISDAHVVYGGVDTEFYRPTFDKKNFFLWMNRWHPAKGYKLAIELARATGIDLVMAGEHPAREQFDYQRDCAHEAMKLSADLPNIHFAWLAADPDHHTSKLALYQQAKALLYTVQFQEPFGLAQAEALACGTPVIGTRFGSVPEVITDGLSGYVCDNSVESLAIAAQKVSELVPGVCRSEAVVRFDREVMARAYLVEYQNVLAGKGWG